MKGLRSCEGWEERAAIFFMATHALPLHAAVVWELKFPYVPVMESILHCWSMGSRFAKSLKSLGGNHIEQSGWPRWVISLFWSVIITFFFWLTVAISNNKNPETQKKYVIAQGYTRLLTVGTVEWQAPALSSDDDSVSFCVYKIKTQISISQHCSPGIIRWHMGRV